MIEILKDLPRPEVYEKNPLRHRLKNSIRKENVPIITPGACPRIRDLLPGSNQLVWR